MRQGDYFGAEPFEVYPEVDAYEGFEPGLAGETWAREVNHKSPKYTLSEKIPLNRQPAFPIEPFQERESSTSKDRVVFIPGIMASRLYVHGLDPKFKYIWGAPSTVNWRKHTDIWMEWLLVGNGLDDGGDTADGPVEPKGLLSMLSVRPYNDFVERLKRNPSIELLVFSYDWRLANQVTSGKLLQAITSKWPNLWADERVTIIAHSMGGLVARHFIESNRDRGYRFVKKLITVGTPHLGAPEAYTHFMGLTLPFSDTNLFLGIAKQVYFPSLSPQQQIVLIGSYASAIQLFPDYDFVFPERGAPVNRNKLYEGLAHYQTSTPVSAIIAGLTSGLKPRPDLDGWLGSGPSEVQVRYEFVAGTDTDTIQGLQRETLSGGRYRTHIMRDLNGDGTVPKKSALLNPAGLTWKNIGTHVFSGVRHDEMFNYDAIQDFCLDGIYSIV